MNMMALSLPARVLVINHILTATIWYFIFAWAPSAADYKWLQNILWGEGLNQDKDCHKVAWRHLIQRKEVGGLGLVDPSVKVVYL